MSSIIKNLLITKEQKAVKDNVRVLKIELAKLKELVSSQKDKTEEKIEVQHGRLMGRAEGFNS